MELAPDEFEEAHQRYIQGQQPARIAFVLTQRRKVEGIEPVKTTQINSFAYLHKWGNERAVFLAAKSKTVAQALSDLKETAALEMVGVVHEYHEHFKKENRMFRKMYKKCETPQDALALSRALESSQRRLFAFHALSDKPERNAAPVHTVSPEQDALSGGEQDNQKAIDIA